MGKQEKFKGKVSNLLPKAASPMTFLSPPPSPVRSNAGKGLSSPRVSLIPKEVRRRARSLSFDAREPTSPKVSCVGQIKNKKKMMKTTKTSESGVCCCPGAITRIFKRKQQSGESDVRRPVEENVPSLGHMKQLASGGGVLQKLDLKVCDVVDGESICPPDSKVNAAPCESITMDGESQYNM